MQLHEAEKRCIVKLHPRLEGKDILSLEGVTIFNVSWFQERLKLEKLDISFLPPNYPPKLLLEYINQNHINGFVYHPINNIEWNKEVEAMHDRGIPIVIIVGHSVDKDMVPILERFEYLGIPSVCKGDDIFYNDFLDALDAAFAAASKTK